MRPPFALAPLGLALLIALASSARAGDRVYPSPEAVKPLGVGAAVPTARVHGVAGDPVDLEQVVRDSGALLVFYRGGW